MNPASNGETVVLPAMSMIDGVGDEDYSFVLALKEGGNDIWFGSSRTESGPRLQITFDDPTGRYQDFGKSTTP